MTLLPILFLCLYCCLNDAGPVPDIGVDCDDPIIFKAVDKALQTYNNAKEDGNLFVLFRVTDAKTRNDANGQKHYSLEYEIREGSCKLKSKQSWQDCQLQENKPEWAKCSAHVLENTEKTIQTVVSQNCNISKEPLEPHLIAVYHQCLGCATPIRTDNKDIQSFVHIAIEKMNTLGRHLYFFDLDQIVNATRQVVSGWDYEIHYVVRKMNCSKIDFKTKDSGECTLDKEGETGECKLHVSLYPQGQVNDIILTCMSQAGFCLSCPLTVDPEDPELQSLLSQVIDEHNSNSNVSKLYKLSRVTKATKHGFHEQIYEVYFSMMPTNCSKPEYTILGDECASEENYFPLSCDTTIHVTDKRIKVHSAPRCIQQEMIVLRISGLSPLRMTQRRSIQTVDNPKIEQHSGGKKNSHHKKHQKNHQEHKRNDEDEEESSEELAVNRSEANVQEVTAASQKNPAFPKCPGKIWQPISLTMTAKPLTDDDLALAAADFNPLPDKEEGTSKTSKQSAGFSDDDLLT